MITALIIWIAGRCFSVGLCQDNTRGREGLLVSVIYMMLWPLLLGCWIRRRVVDE